MKGHRSLNEPTKRGSMLAAVLLGVLASMPVSRAQVGGRVIEVIADSDNRFKVPGREKPVITLKAGEEIRLRIIARKGPEWNKDGIVHSFTIVELKDEGWDLLLNEGTQELTLRAPAYPGIYKVECTVKCGLGHNQMRMKVIVTP